MAEATPIDLDISEVMIVGTIPCGPGELPLDDGVWTSLESELSKRPEFLRFVRVKGTSMKGARIYPGDIIAYDISDTRPSEGDIVVANITSIGYTVKEFKGGMLVSRYGKKKQAFALGMDAEILGVMVCQIIKRRR